MDNKKSSLRRRAEDKSAQSLHYIETQTPEQIQEMLHELRVHQIELEMQNEELRQAQSKLEAERARYFAFYNLSPVGFLTLSEQGLILEANSISATMLVKDLIALINQPITRFIFKEDHDAYYLHCKQRSMISRLCAVFYPYVHGARRSATTMATGTRWKCMCITTPRQSSAMAFVRSATRNIFPQFLRIDMKTPKKGETRHERQR